MGVNFHEDLRRTVGHGGSSRELDESLGFCDLLKKALLQRLRDQ